MQAIFLDRDGVINENRSDYVKSWEEFQLLPGALAALRLLSEAGWPIFIVTNQAAVNRGLITHETLQQIHHNLVSLARQYGATISALRYCPHRPDEHCDCRKPAPGMLHSLAEEFGIDLQRSYMIGDALTDIAAGQAAGCRTALVSTGRGREQLHLPEIQRWRPTMITRDLFAAARWVLAEERAARRMVRPYQGNLARVVGEAALLSGA